MNTEIPRNQITVLLGHNGAGKTTFLSMICGLIPPTSGTIALDGETDMRKYRNSIGYCPQHNILMPYFTCREHLRFFGGVCYIFFQTASNKLRLSVLKCVLYSSLFAQVRGLDGETCNKQIPEILEKLDLHNNANDYASTLSGGRMRRLCLGNALVGKTVYVPFTSY